MKRFLFAAAAGVVLFVSANSAQGMAVVSCYTAYVSVDDGVGGTATFANRYCDVTFYNDWYPVIPGYREPPILTGPPARTCYVWRLGLACANQSCNFAQCESCCNYLYPCYYGCDPAAVQRGLVNYDVWLLHTACMSAPDGGPTGCHGLYG